MTDQEQFQEQYNKAFDRGKKEGRYEGHTEGYSIGYDAGYDEGYKNGVNVTEVSSSKEAVASALVNMTFSDMMNIADYIFESQNNYTNSSHIAQMINQWAENVLLSGYQEKKDHNP